MTLPSNPLILSIDDDPITLKLLHRILTLAGYQVITAQSGAQAFNILSQTKPDLILLDIMMSGMNGYQVCSKIQENEALAYIPVIFVTALNSEPDKKKAFAVGGVDYITKPFSKADILQKVDLHLKTNAHWDQVHQDFISWDKWSLPENFLKFKEFLYKKLHIPKNKQEQIQPIRPAKLYSIASALDLEDSQLAKYIAEFLQISYLEEIKPEMIQLGVLPPLFCKANSIVPVRSNQGGKGFILSNPFHWELLDSLNRFIERGKKPEIAITQPDNILSLFSQPSVQVKVPDSQLATNQSNQVSRNQATTTSNQSVQSVNQQGGVERSIEQAADTILAAAVSSRASDIHIEPKLTHALVRFRIDGDLHDVRKFPNETAAKVITRLKALGGLEITERRKPQDGAFETYINNRFFRLRLATTSTPDGESMIIRMLEPTAKPKPLKELGMTEGQVEKMIQFAKQTQGLIVIVGPTGSGKSTTIYSLLSQVDTKSRSLISVEDPIEYRIFNANQQQVNDKAGVTFESLLKSAMRQDPDILYLGEIRDSYSAKVGMEFASTGHLTISSLHSASATSAIFRLEQLGIPRATMADALLGIVAQKLLKKLCPHCKEVQPITDKEAAILEGFTDNIPSVVAHPVGCNKCNQTGYFGREGIYEVLHFDAVLTEMVRREVPISAIRDYARQRGDCLIANHAVEKVRNLLFSPQDIYERVLLEESRSRLPIPEKNSPSLTPTHNVNTVSSATPKLRVLPSLPNSKNSVLVIESEESDKSLLQRWLETAGYEVVVPIDGVDALFELGKRKFDLILANVNMPSLNGQRLLEILHQRQIDTPTIFLTADPIKEIEIKGLDLGAADYIKKPLRNDIVLLRVNNHLNSRVEQGEIQQAN